MDLVKEIMVIFRLHVGLGFRHLDVDSYSIMPHANMEGFSAAVSYFLHLFVRGILPAGQST